MPLSRERRTRSRLTGLLDVQALVLHFEEEIALAENVAQPVGGVARFVVALPSTSGSATAPLRQAESAISPRLCLRQQVVIDARLVVEAFEESRGDQLDEVAIAFGIFAQQNQMIGAALASGLAPDCLPAAAPMRPRASAPLAFPRRDRGGCRARHRLRSR